MAVFIEVLHVQALDVSGSNSPAENPDAIGRSDTGA
jgi:hypothetical protein